MENILSQLAPYVIAAIVAVIARVIQLVGTALIDFIEKKKEEVIKRIGQTKYEESKSIAFTVWNIVEEHFRVTSFIGDSIQLKIAMFDKLLLEKVPGLTESEISYLRQGVAGIVNAGKEKLVANSNTIENTNTSAIENPVMQDTTQTPQYSASDALNLIQNIVQNISK